MENTTEEHSVTWWQPVCGNKTEQDALWSHQLTLNTSSPDLTQCFQKTFLVWIPSALLLLSTPFYLIHLKSQPTVRGKFQFSWMQIIKLINCILLLVLSLVNLFTAVSSLHPLQLTDWLTTYLVYSITYVVATVVTYLEYRRGQHSSGVMWCFWCVSLIAEIVPIRSKILHQQYYTLDGGASTYSIPGAIDFVTEYISFGMIVVNLILHSFSDKSCFIVKTATIKKRQFGEGYAMVNLTEKIKLVEGEMQNVHPFAHASFPSRILYTWVTGMLLLGYKRNLTVDKLWELLPYDKAKPLVQKFYKFYSRSDKRKRKATVKPANFLFSNSKNKTNYKEGRLEDEDEDVINQNWEGECSIVKATWGVFGFYYMAIALFEIGHTVVSFMRPLVLDAIITYIISDDTYAWQGYFYLAVMLFLSILKAIFANQLFDGKILTYVRFRSAITAAVYRKALKLTNYSKQEYSVGEIVNLMSVDANRLAAVATSLHNLWQAPLNISVAMFFLWGYLGPASLVGFGILVLLMALDVLMASRMKKLQVAHMKFSDKRVKIINEILNGIKVLKLYAWEKAFQDKVSAIRKEELRLVLRTAYYGCAIFMSAILSPLLFTIGAFTTYPFMKEGNELTAQVAFVSLALVYNLIRPFSTLPHSIAAIVEATVSLKRLHKFFRKEELDEKNVTCDRSDPNTMSISDGTFSWDTGETTVLKNIQLRVPKGSLTAVVGQVGAGKSSLLSAVLGDLTKVEGKVNVVGSIAYVPQEAWIRNTTLQNNVLFGKEVSKARYDKTLEACALLQDLEILPGGDQTEIGEKGINLSGGQKQRISLARAVYHDKDIYLLDDPLSAVDVHVGKHIFEKVLGPRGVLKNKTRLLVTHGITYLSKADQIVVLKDGQISEMGTYEELMAHNGAFADLITNYLTESPEEEENLDKEDLELREDLRKRCASVSSSYSRPASPLSEVKSLHLLQRSVSVSSNTSRVKTPIGSPHKSTLSLHGYQGELNSKPYTMSVESLVKSDPENENIEYAGLGATLINEEETFAGKIQWHVFQFYYRALSKCPLVIILCSFILSIATDLYSNIWLSQWSSDFDGNNPKNKTISPAVRVAVYGSVGLVQVICFGIQLVAFANATTAAAAKIHDKLMDTIVKAPMEFFDTTPLGRILNRFSGDMNFIDFAIRGSMNALLRGAVAVCTMFIATLYATPMFATVLLPLGIVYYFVQRFFIMTSNQLRRLHSVLASPIYSHFGESIAGTSSIRAYGLQKQFVDRSDDLLDCMQSSSFGSQGVSRWLGVWLELFGAVIVLFASLFAILSKGEITGGLAGLSITYALQVTDRLSMFVRNTSEIENNVVAVERVKEYSSVELEADWEIEDNRPPKEWPVSGAVSFQSYGTRYREGLQLVLEKLVFDVKPGEKVGIVGRTGAGKSSITLGLFRILEAAEGSIVIDGIKTSAIGLHDLRKKLTIIPQDPILFTGDLRSNLDPLDLYPDAEVWTALEHAHLKDFVASLPEKLHHECTEGGHNLSVGQRQLVCLARALLRKTKILILDEATAAIDMETDDLIQTTIRSEFKDATVLTIAHRINTILDYDRILVLDHGRVKEYDSPANLQKNANSVFHNMCKGAGLLPSQNNKEKDVKDSKDKQEE